MLHAQPSSAIANPASQADQVTNGTYDSASFSAELNRISAILGSQASGTEIRSLRKSLPKAWIVTTPEKQYIISTERLQNLLNISSSTLSSQEGARIWVERLQQEVNDYVKPRATSGQPRAELDKILSRPEFAGVRPPSAWELMRQRIVNWLLRFIGGIFGTFARYPLGGTILFWLIIVAAVAGIAALLFRFFANRDRMTALPAKTTAVPGRTWQEWVRAAREAARAGNYREAVHSAYWAGIARLEDLGVVPKDRTKTPREYLRLVVEPALGELAAPATHREPLAALTRRLETVWYANRGARPEDYTESLLQLEALGCPLE